MSKASVPLHFFTQSAVIPYRKRKGALEVLLITSRRKKRWIIPKGIKELDMSAQQSAAKEAFEEAGIEGKVSHTSIGSYQNLKWGGKCTVRIYCMKVQKVHKKWNETWRKRKWVPIDDVSSYINNKKLQQVVLRLPALLKARSIKWIAPVSKTKAQKQSGKPVFPHDKHFHRQAARK